MAGDVQGSGGGDGGRFKGSGGGEVWARLALVNYLSDPQVYLRVCLSCMYVCLYVTYTF